MCIIVNLQRVIAPSPPTEKILVARVMINSEYICETCILYEEHHLSDMSFKFH